METRTSQVILDHEEMQSLEQLAAMLETIAKHLREEGKFTFVQGGKEIEVAPSQQVGVEVKYEIKQKKNKHQFEIEFEWIPGQESQKMTIK